MIGNLTLDHQVVLSIPFDSKPGAYAPGFMRAPASQALVQSHAKTKNSRLTDLPGSYPLFGVRVHIFSGSKCDLSNSCFGRSLDREYP